MGFQLNPGPGEGADKANTIRRSQAKERAAVQKDIEANQKTITQLNDEAAPIRAEVRKVEADVGPIKYIAALIYGDNPDANLLEHAVRWVIILIVSVFDPLALTLLLAATKTFEWEHNIDLFNLKKKKEEETKYEADDGPLSKEQLNQLIKTANLDLPKGEIIAKESLFPEDLSMYDDFFNGTKSLHDIEEPVDPKLAPTPLEPDPLPEVHSDPAAPGQMFVEEPITATQVEPIEENDVSKHLKSVWLANNPNEDADTYYAALANREITSLPWHQYDHIESLPISDRERKEYKNQKSLCYYQITSQMYCN